MMSPLKLRQLAQRPRGTANAPVKSELVEMASSMVREHHCLGRALFLLGLEYSGARRAAEIFLKP